jgi:hypothetical protein
MTLRIFAMIAVATIMVGCRQTPEQMGAAVDNDSNVLTGGPITGVTLQDLPPAVTETLKQQVPHAEIKLIEQKTRAGQVAYKFTFTESSNTPELYVSEDGTVLPTSTKEEK